MAWVKGIREVKYYRVPADEVVRHGPVRFKSVRTIIDLPAEAISRTVQRGQWLLPLHTGAGPCGTLACRVFRPKMIEVWGDQTRPEPASPLAWSVEHLVEPLRTFYATHREPLRFGAKSGPRGRQAA